MSTKEYKAVKNFIHNECGISKDDIREVIRKEVREQFENQNTIALVRKEMLNVFCESYGGLSFHTKEMLKNTSRSVEVMRNEAIEKAIMDNITVSLKTSLD